MRTYLLINSFLHTEHYYDDVYEFNAALYASVCGKAKVVCILPNDTRALFVYQICDVYKD